MKTFLIAVVMFVALCVGEAHAGRNLWTYRIYPGRPSDGCVVKCKGASCVHGCDRVTVTRHGIRYRVRSRVVPAKGGLGVQVSVRAKVVDGQTHGFDDSLTLDGREFRLPPFAPGEVLSLSGLGLSGWSHPPQLGAGQSRSMKDQWPADLKWDGIPPGHRLVLPVRINWVKHPGWPRSTKPTVATVVLTVPYRGKPRVRIF